MRGLVGASHFAPSDNRCVVLLNGDAHCWPTWDRLPVADPLQDCLGASQVLTTSGQLLSSPSNSGGTGDVPWFVRPTFMNWWLDADAD